MPSDWKSNRKNTHRRIFEHRIVQHTVQFEICCSSVRFPTFKYDRRFRVKMDFRKCCYRCVCFMFIYGLRNLPFSFVDLVSLY